MFYVFSNEGSPSLLSGFNGLLLKTAGRQLEKASLRLAKALARSVFTAVPLKPIILLLIALGLILLLNMTCFYSMVDEVEAFFTNMGEGIRELSSIPDRLFLYIKDTVIQLIRNGKTPGDEDIHIVPALINRCMDIENESINSDEGTKRVKARVVEKIVRTIQKFVWAGEGEFTRDVTEITRSIEDTYEYQNDRRIKTGSITTITEKTVYYPLPALKGVITPFKTYRFRYDTDVTVKEEITGQNVKTDPYRTLTEESSIRIVEDWVSEIIKEINPGFLGKPVYE